MPFIMCRNRNFRQHQRVGRCRDTGDLSGTSQRVEASQMDNLSKSVISNIYNGLRSSVTSIPKDFFEVPATKANEMFLVDGRAPWRFENTPHPSNKGIASSVNKHGVCV